MLPGRDLRDYAPYLACRSYWEETILESTLVPSSTTAREVVTGSVDSEDLQETTSLVAASPYKVHRGDAPGKSGSLVRLRLSVKTRRSETKDKAFGK